MKQITDSGKEIKMRKFFLIALSLLMVFYISACGSKTPASNVDVQKKADEMLDKIVDDMFEEDESIVINKQAGEWPDNEFTSLVPKPTTGVVKVCSTSGNTCTILLIEDFETYSFWKKIT